MIPLTALILTYNERENIGRTLTALTWIDEIVLIDSFSTDDTLALARAANPRVRIVQRPFDSFAAQCNFGLTQVQTPWVLSLDADYVLSSDISAEISELAPTNGVAAYSAHFRYCVWGHPLRATLYPPRTVLYRRNTAHYEDEGHGHRVKIQGTVLSLRGPIHHDDRKPLSRWLVSQDRYMKIEAPHLLAASVAGLSAQDRLRRRGALAPPVMFLYLLLVRGLVLDGWPGWFYVFQRTLAEVLLAIRIIIERERLETPL